VFSPAVRDSLPPGGAGRIAQGVLLATFHWQAGLAAAACGLHALGRWRGSVPPSKLRNSLLPLLLAASLAAVFWVHPVMKGHFEDKYRVGTPESQRAESGRRFAAWHGASQAGNLLILAATLACWWQLAQIHPIVSVTDHPSRTRGKGDRGGPLVP
jgi:hypothetical protein